MSNALDMVEEAYEFDRYKRYPIHLYKVPMFSWVTGFDHYNEDFATVENEALSKPSGAIDRELLLEYRQLMRHRSSFHLREEFTRCRGDAAGDCAICSTWPSRAPTSLDKFLDRFPDQRLPTPVPVLRPEPTSGEPYEHFLEELMCRRPPEEEAADIDLGKKKGHYRSFWEIAKSSLPERCFKPDEYYYGPSKRRSCPDCKNLSFRTDSAFQRHRKLMHSLMV